MNKKNLIGCLEKRKEKEDERFWFYIDDYIELIKSRNKEYVTKWIKMDKDISEEKIRTNSIGLDYWKLYLSIDNFILTNYV